MVQVAQLVGVVDPADARLAALVLPDEARGVEDGTVQDRVRDVSCARSRRKTTTR